MATTTGIIKGHDLMVFVGGSSIAYATSHTIETTVDTSEVSHKDNNGDWKEVLAQKKSWTATSENLYALPGSSTKGKNYAELYAAMTEGQELELKFSLKHPQSTTPVITGEPPYSPDYPTLQGKAVITSLSLNAPDADNATYSVTFTGTGPLLYQATAPTAAQKHTAAGEAEKTERK